MVAEASSTRGCLVSAARLNGGGGALFLIFLSSVPADALKGATFSVGILMTACWFSMEEYWYCYL